MLALMRDPQVPLKDRVFMAEAAAPFVHARPRSPSGGRAHPMELRARAAKAAGQNGGAKGAASGREDNPSLQSALSRGDENPTLQPALPDGAEQAEIVGGGEAVVVRLASPGPHAIERFEIRPPSPLDFLLAVMADPDAEPKERMRAAQVAARYKHTLVNHEPSMALVRDEFGFKIDPAVACKIREIDGERDFLARSTESLPRQRRREITPDDVQKYRTLVKQLHEQIATIACSEIYHWPDLQNDETRVKEIREPGGKPRKKLPAALDAEEAYLIARMETYRASPKHQAWCRISELEDRRADGEILTDAETRELSDLRARFPTVAQQFATGLGCDKDTTTLNDPEREQRRRDLERLERFKGIAQKFGKGLGCDEAAATRDDHETQARRRLEWQERCKVSERQADFLAERLEARARPSGIISFEELARGSSSTKPK